ncbi:oxidoreductase [Actinoplanes lobatus]|uniref:Oxidoreductase n=1 Tax=Actinoplanes lobatus TaxID=113568 RepID=A0A7W7HM62_9ACTN|nr:NAD(P)/FAD-dependent oxidoreductase [Actinoplanes lobatus]MBB4753073.1 2-polyprenyl-6-methoxyphenol hydroxylase-like FAD-dependent oxidoreductase [Actinoplanes lobatus]GGN87158.1 oxidoreductase [Actinoplanes lobatus]GIE39680.1 oxidoreductase [Actinoplanes lobatus]
MTNFHVLVIGAGIGGLALAQGLRQAGVPVTVFERTRTRTDWLQGYRIHINPAGSRALHDCLPPPAWQRFLDTVSTVGGGFGFVTEQLRDLLRFTESEITPDAGPADSHHGASRIGLREALLTGLDDEVLHLGAEFERYSIAPDGRVTAHFTDGRTATGDLLVGADGANSRVRGQLLPHARRVDTGVLTIAGKHRLPDPELPGVLVRDTNMVIPAGRGSLFTSVWHPDRATVPADTTGDPFLFGTSSAYAIWGFGDATATFPPGVTDLPGLDLRDLVLDRTTGWAPELRRLVKGSDPATINAIRVRSATPVGPWETGPVTLLGDAIHNMTPMAGIGANTALRDADLLRLRLIAAARGAMPLHRAVSGYEEEMREYGFAAVAQSLRNARMSASGSRTGRYAFRTVLRSVHAIAPLRRRMATGLGS